MLGATGLPELGHITPSGAVSVGGTELTQKAIPFGVPGSMFAARSGANYVPDLVKCI